MRNPVEPATAGQSRPAPRLCLEPTGSADALLDGGWWPRSYDPVAELRQLILAIDDRHLPIARVQLAKADWGSRRPRMLRIDGPAATRIIPLRWFDAMPTGLLTAVCSDGRRLHLLTVPPYTKANYAWAAMELAAQPDNQLHTPDLLRALGDIGPTAQIASAAALPVRTWENEGGHLAKYE